MMGHPRGMGILPMIPAHERAARASDLRSMGILPMSITGVSPVG